MSEDSPTQDLLDASNRVLLEATEQLKKMQAAAEKLRVMNAKFEAEERRQRGYNQEWEGELVGGDGETPE